MTNAPRPPTVPVVHFDTLDFDPTDRFDAWRENMGVFFDLLAPDGGILTSDIRAQIDACNLGETVLGVTRAQSQLFERNRRRVAGDNLDHILVQVFLNGGGLVDGDQQITAGDMLIIDLEQPHTMLNGDFENLTLVLPREVRSNLADLLAPLHGKQLSGQNPMVRFMGEHLQALWRTVPDMDLRQAGSALEGTFGLMESWLIQDGHLPQELDREVSSALGKSIRRHIERHLSEPLSPQALANEFLISRSQIYRIFEPDGGVARYIWERRMRRSLRLLSQPQFNHLAIGTIAFECGFSSESHFSRSFRSRYGSTPGKIRAEAILSRNDQAAVHNTTMTETAHFSQWIREM